MAEIKNDVTFTLGYVESDQERTYKFSGVSATYLSGIESAVTALNASIEGGTDDGLKNFFIADDYDDSDSEDVIGTLKKVNKVKIDSTTETVIF